MDDPFDFGELRIRQPGRLIAGHAKYEIFDNRRHLLATACPMSVGVPVVPIGTIGLRGPSNRAGLRHSSVPSGAPRPPDAPGRSPNGVRPSRCHWARSSGLSGFGAVGVKLLTRIP